MRDSLIFYRSFYEAIKELPKETQAEVYTAIFEYSLNFNELQLSGLAKTIFTLIKPQLEANNKRFINGSKAKSKQDKSETEAKPKQKESKTEANNNNNVNNNVNDNKKEKKVLFNNSNLFDKNIFKSEFSEWNNTKLSYYYNAALAYSNEGNKYVNWKSAINSWAKRDELQGKLKFDSKNDAKTMEQIIEEKKAYVKSQGFQV
jgi:Ni,Fe-hydrogenase I large subunit